MNNYFICLLQDKILMYRFFNKKKKILIKANKGNQIDILHHLPVPYLFVTFTILKEFKSLADARNYDIS